MTGKAKGEAFVKLPRELIESAAWRALGLNSRRFIDFLLIEHMNHGGQRNGFLLAPRRQLENFIGAHLVSAAIVDAERLGLVDCRRGLGRLPNLYALTWLPLSDGAPPSNRFRERGAVAETVLAARKAAKRRESLKNRPVVTAQMTARKNDCTNDSQLPPQMTVTKAVATAQMTVTKAEIIPPQMTAPSKNILPRRSRRGTGREPGTGVPRRRARAMSPPAAAETAQTADQSIPGKPNGKDHDMTAQREITAVVPLRVRRGNEISK
jgi:hypothetical protein